MGFVVQTFQHIPPLLVYLLVALFLLLESSGIPLLNTTLLLCMGALAALGKLNLAVLICVAIVGSTAGALSAYGLGRRYGEPLLLRLTRFLGIDEKKVSLAEKWFATAGARMVFFSRMLPYIRPFACFPAGISAMLFSHFALAALAGSSVWCVTILTVGWELGPRWKEAVHLLRFYTLPTFGVLLVLLVTYFLCKRSLARYIKKRMEVGPGERDHDLLEV